MNNHNKTNSNNERKAWGGSQSGVATMYHLTCPIFNIMRHAKKQGERQKLL